MRWHLADIWVGDLLHDKVTISTRCKMHIFELCRSTTVSLPRLLDLKRERDMHTPEPSQPTKPRDERIFTLLSASERLKRSHSGTGTFSSRHSSSIRSKTSLKWYDNCQLSRLERGGSVRGTRRGDKSGRQRAALGQHLSRKGASVDRKSQVNGYV